MVRKKERKKTQEIYSNLIAASILEGEENATRFLSFFCGALEEERKKSKEDGSENGR